VLDLLPNPNIGHFTKEDGQIVERTTHIPWCASEGFGKDFESHVQKRSSDARLGANCWRCWTRCKS